MGAVGSFLAACLSQNAPAASPTGGVGVGPITQQPTVTLKFQSSFAPQDLFHEMLVDYAKKVGEISGGRIKIDTLPNNSVVPFTQLIDAVHQGVLDGGLGVPAYWYGKNRAFSLWGTGPSLGMDASMLLGWINYGGGQALYDEFLKDTMKLNVQSYFFGAMPTQPLGWFQKEVTSADQFKGLKYRTVGLSADLFTEMGANVQTLAGGDIVPALQTGRIDAAEYNNTTSDKLLGFQDVSKILMFQSYHQPLECMEMLFNRTKYEGFPADVKAILRYAILAQDADFTYKFQDRNSKDLIEIRDKFNVKIVRTPTSILDAQLAAWDKIVERESSKADTGPIFKKVLESQRAWAQRVVQWNVQVMVDKERAFNHFFAKR